jgi:small-conductance mechanosensitive channel
VTGTNGTKPASVVTVLQRADSRWAKQKADDPAPHEYLEHLATFVQPLVQNGHGTPATDDRDLARLREQVTAAENNAAARRTERDEARAEIEQLRAAVEGADQRREDMRLELQRHVDAQENRAEHAEAERDQLAEQLAMMPAPTAQADAVEVQQLRDQVAELQAAGIESTKLIGELRADYDAATHDTQKLADELEAMRADRDALVARVVAADQHHCTWQWHGPDEPIKPCTCGRAAPRYELREVS